MQTFSNKNIHWIELYTRDIMLEVSTVKKNKVNLSDYNCQQDIHNRSLIAELNFFEHEVLQEIFFSPSKFSISKLARNLSCEVDQIFPTLKKFSLTGLLTIQDDAISVDKEVRKYFEFHLKRFEVDFKPDMEYLQGILRKVPIHVLPLWYAIPRTSNNIFDSIVERYLLTPHLFQKYIAELSFANPYSIKIMQDVFAAPHCKLPSSVIMQKYNLSRSEFEEAVLLLEFSFACCATYTKTDSKWEEFVTTFHEWGEYIKFCKNISIPSFEESPEIEKKRSDEFAFVKDLAEILQYLQQKPSSQAALLQEQTLKTLFQLLSLPIASPKQQHAATTYVLYLIQKLEVLQLTDCFEGVISPSKIAKDFLLLSSEKKAMYLYRHPTNKILNPRLPLEIATEKNLRETEKSVRQVLKKPWVFFDDFISGVIICLNDTNSITLKKIGKSWKYLTPTYSEKEVEFIKIVVLEWLFEAGIVMTGTLNGRDCFTVTSFGRLFFEE